MLAVATSAFIQLIKLREEAGKWNAIPTLSGALVFFQVLD